MLRDRHLPSEDLAGPPPPEAVKSRLPSIVWLVPIVALLLAGWLAYRTLSERGPLVSMTFDNADGLEAGKTQIKYRDVQIGSVETISIADDLGHVVVTARMDRDIAPHLTEQAKFWVVRPRVGLGGVSGLGTLVSGAYVAMEPGRGGEAQRAFTGLEQPPVIPSNEPGTQFVLTADSIGSIDRGSPVYFRDIPAGTVLDYKLTEDQQAFEISVFVQQPYDASVNRASKFWNAGGFEAGFGTDGFQVSVTSLETLLIGGVAFETGPAGRDMAQAPAGTEFPLYANRLKAEEADFSERVPFLVYFEGSVRGLREGAPVELRGLRVGSVTGIRLTFDQASGRVRIPVTLGIEPARLMRLSDQAPAATAQAMYANAEEFVREGLRAQLKSGNLLTGEMLVALDFHEDVPAATLGKGDAYPVIPAVPEEIEAITASVSGILDKLSSLQIEPLIEDLRKTTQAIGDVAGSEGTQEAVASIQAAAASLQATLQTIQGDAAPTLSSIRAAARSAQNAAASVDGLVGRNAPLPSETSQLMRELTSAARSIRVFADYLERHPEALIQGKRGYGYGQ